jgi:hypothetical protein
MNHWNHRIIRTKYESGDVFRIHEVYYAKDGTIEGWTENPVLPQGESTSELRADILYFMSAFQKPVLEESLENGKPVLKADEEEDQINRGHYFELMDRASVALVYCREFVGDHPVARREEKLKKLFEKVENALYELYQEAGRLEFEQQD